MSLLVLLLPAAMAIILAAFLTPTARRLAIAVGAVDLPSERKVHATPIPRLGGLAVLASIVLVTIATFLIAPEHQSLPGDVLFGIALGLLPVVVVSIWDDIKPLRSFPKFAAHALGAGVAIWFGVVLSPTIHLFNAEIHLGWLAIPLSFLWLVGLTNAFNIVDGLDGLSAGLALISAISLAGVSIFVGRYEMAMSALILAGALIGFLPFNTHPARIFLGDSGAAAVGFILAALTLRGGSTLNAGMAVLVPLVVVGLPVAETLVSMTRRFVRRVETHEGSGVFEADRNHFHHRLLALGLDHKRAVFTLYGVGFLLAAAGFASMFMKYRSAGILLTTIVIALIIGVNRLKYDEFALVRRGVFLRAYDTPVLKSSFFAVFVDLALVLIAMWGAIALKFDDWLLAGHLPLVRELLVVLPPVSIAVFYSFRMYRGAWKLAGIDDFIRASSASFVSAFVSYLVLSWGIGNDGLVSLFIIYALVLATFINGVRGSYRVLLNWKERSSTAGTPVVIYGAGVGGAMALREILSNKAVGMRAVGFIDDDPTKHSRFIQGFPILGTLEEAEAILARGQVKGVVVSSERVPQEKLKTLRAICAGQGVWLRYFRLDFRIVDEYEAAELGGVKREMGANAIYVSPDLLAKGRESEN